MRQVSVLKKLEVQMGNRRGRKAKGLMQKLLPSFLLSRNVVCFLLGKWFFCGENTAVGPFVRKAWPEWVKMRSRDKVLHNIRC